MLPGMHQKMWIRCSKTAERARKEQHPAGKGPVKSWHIIMALGPCPRVRNVRGAEKIKIKMKLKIAVHVIFLYEATGDEQPKHLALLRLMLHKGCASAPTSLPVLPSWELSYRGTLAKKPVFQPRVQKKKPKPHQNSKKSWATTLSSSPWFIVHGSPCQLQVEQR